MVGQVQNSRGITFSPWTQHLALTGSPARTWEPKRLRLRLLNIAGRIVTTGRRHLLRLPRR